MNQPQEDLFKHREWTEDELREGYQSLPEKDREHYVRYSGGPKALPPLLDPYVRHPKLKLAPFSGQ